MRGGVRSGEAVGTSATTAATPTANGLDHNRITTLPSAAHWARIACRRVYNTRAQQVPARAIAVAAAAETVVASLASCPGQQEPDRPAAVSTDLAGGNRRASVKVAAGAAWEGPLW